MSYRFKLNTQYAPAGDQPEAIAKLIEGLENGLSHQTLLGVTGSGKTFTAANVIQAVQRPTLILAPNKTLAAQLYGEMKSFFPISAELNPSAVYPSTSRSRSVSFSPSTRSTILFQSSSFSGSGPRPRSFISVFMRRRPLPS